MKINLKDNPFAEDIKGCDSPGAVLQLLERNRDEFKEYRDKNRKFIDCLNPVVQFVHAFSRILGEATSLVSHHVLLVFFFLLFLRQVPFQPAKLVFVGIDVLFSVRVFLHFVSANRVPLISIHTRRLKESALAMTLSLNSLSASEASSNASKFIPRST